MSKIVIHNQAIIDGLTKDLPAERVKYVDNVLHYKPVLLSNTYTEDEIKAISKFLNDWFKDTYIYGSDAMDVIGGIKDGI